MTRDDWIVGKAEDTVSIPTGENIAYITQKTRCVDRSGNTYTKISYIILEERENDFLHK